MGKTQGHQVLGGGLSGIKRSRLRRKLSNSTSGLWIFNCRDISYHLKEGHKLSPCAVFLYQLVNTETYYMTANLFGIGKSTIWEINVQVCNVIVQVLLRRYICLPQSAQRIQEMIDEEQPCRPSSGCSLCCWMPFLEDYVNWKEFHSIILQGLVNVNSFVLDICVSWPGKVHDAGFFKNSSPLQWCPHKRL